MAVTAFWYGLGLKGAFNAECDWVDGTVKCALATSSYTPNQDTHDYWDDVSANEVSGTGYSAGGATLGSKTLTYTGGTNILAMDAADVTWSSSTITARYAIIYMSTGNAATSLLLGYVDFGADQSSSNGNFTITWDSGGILKITAA